MDIESLNQILGNVASGKISVQNAARKLKHLSFEDLDYAHIDHHRSLRKGFPEVIFGQKKTAEQIIGIMEKMLVQEKVEPEPASDAGLADRLAIVAPARRNELLDAQQLLLPLADIQFML